MLYLLDANVLITAQNSYYPIDQIPEFWDWILHNAENNRIKMPIEIVDEIKRGRKDDPLVVWLKNNEQTLRFDEEADPTLVQRVVYNGYASDLTDDEIEQLGHDPLLIAYALAQPNNRCVVTTEVSKPSKQRQNKKIPDVCNLLNILWCNTFALNRTLGFRTSWRG